jgi:hypothetical protein
MIQAKLHTSNVHNIESSDYLPVSCVIGRHCTRPVRHVPSRGTSNAEVR